MTYEQCLQWAEKNSYSKRFLAQVKAEVADGRIEEEGWSMDELARYVVAGILGELYAVALMEATSEFFKRYPTVDDDVWETLGYHVQEAYGNDFLNDVFTVN